MDEFVVAAGDGATGVKELKIDSAITFHHAEIDDDLVIASGANSIKWHYTLNTAVTPTIGGEVTQILSAYVGPMVIEGVATSNDQLKKIKNWFETYFHIAGTAYRDDISFRNERAVAFQYPARGWSFYVDPTDFQGWRFDKSVYAVPWSVTCEIVSDNALNYLSGVTMTSFTGPMANPAFIQVGYSDPTGSGKASMFVNPLLSGDIPGLGKTMGDNFQRLIASFATGNFQDFAFGYTKDFQLAGLPKDINAEYTKAFGSPYIVGGSNAKTGGGGSGSGTITYGTIIQNPTTQAQVVQDIATIFENKGVPAQLGVAVAYNESHFDPNIRQPPLDCTNCGVGLYQMNRDASGRGNGKKIRAGMAAIAHGGKFTDGYPAVDQITDAATWFAQLNPLGSNFDPTDVDQMAHWGQVAQVSTEHQFNQYYVWATGHASSAFKSAWNAAGTYIQASGAVPTTGDSATLAQRLLNLKGTKWFDDNGQGTAQLKLVAQGKRLNGPGGLVRLDPGTLQTVLYLIDQGFTVGTYAWCTDHGFDSMEGHSGGKAVDISSLNGTAINVDSSSVKKNVLGALHLIHDHIKPRQLISGGYGNHSDSQCIALCLTDPRGQNPHTYYTDAVLAQHENHIHTGF